MKTSHKRHIRTMILDLLSPEDIRLRMYAHLQAVKTNHGEDIDEFEAMEFYEQEVERINRMFCYPMRDIETSNTNGSAEVTPCR